jgi:hypothetical protein
VTIDHTAPGFLVVYVCHCGWLLDDEDADHSGCE